MLSHQPAGKAWLSLRFVMHRLTRAFTARIHNVWTYSKTCVKQPLSNRQKTVFQDSFSLNAGQKYCRRLKGEHSAILLTFIKLPFIIKIFVLSIFEWPFYTGFTVDEVSDQTMQPLALLDTSAWAFFRGTCPFGISAKI